MGQFVCFDEYPTFGNPFDHRSIAIAVGHLETAKEAEANALATLAELLVEL